MAAFGFGGIFLGTGLEVGSPPLRSSTIPGPAANPDPALVLGNPDPWLLLLEKPVLPKPVPEEVTCDGYC